MWKKLDKLSKITPFNQPNEENEFKNLSEHVEKNQEEWYAYIYEDRIRAE